jgi:hypothetical protein
MAYFDHGNHFFLFGEFSYLGALIFLNEKNVFLENFSPLLEIKNLN